MEREGEAPPPRDGRAIYDALLPRHTRRFSGGLVGKPGVRGTRISVEWVDWAGFFGAVPRRNIRLRVLSAGQSD